MKDLVIIIVLYKVRLGESPAFCSLVKILSKHIKPLPFCLVYDNSPTQQFDSDNNYTVNNIPIYYIHNSTNPGISEAYNKGLEVATNLNKKWLLLLDQDSKLPDNYIEIFINSLKKYNNYKITAYLPKVKVNDRVISPAKVKNSGRVVLFKNSKVVSYEGLYKNLSAINSGVFISIKFMNYINGFSPNYPLDMLDHWLFKHIALNNLNVIVMPTYIEHDLSIFGKKDISIMRYQSILHAEKKFVYEFGSLRDIIVYKLRLILRLFSDAKNKRYGKIKKTIEFIFK